LAGWMFAFALAGCGGGGGDGMDTAAAGGESKMLPTIISSDGRLANSCSYSAPCSGNPYAPFIVYRDTQPPDGTILSGIVRLQVRGHEMANVELLPSTGFLPRYGVFGLSRDKFVGWIDFDTRTLPNGRVPVRISAFNAPAGQSGVEMYGMTARSWYINNPPIPPGFSANLSAAPGAGSTVSGIVRFELRGTGITNAELLPASGYAPRHGQFNVSADKTYAWLDFDTRVLADGPSDLRISVFDATPGQANAHEIVAMPARRLNISNGSNGSFTGSVTTAPMHGARVNGWVTIEVRGKGMKNVELLPAAGYQPIVANFTESFDGTFAFLDLDTTTLPNGPLNVRVSAFSVAAGQPNAKEIVVMPARQWVVQN
jgi:hypothetical protein